MHNCGGCPVKENIIWNKSYAFAVRIVKLRRYLKEEKQEYIISAQVCKSGTSICANVTEAQRAQSRADFTAKLNIALKEAQETLMWLQLLYDTEYVDRVAYESLHRDACELVRILGAICKKLPQKS